MDPVLYTLFRLRLLGPGASEITWLVSWDQYDGLALGGSALGEELSNLAAADSCVFAATGPQVFLG